MLARADADLVRRDLDVPGLAVVLDPDAFAAALAAQFDEPIESAEITYVRYKPGQSCLVGYRVVSAGQSNQVCATAYRSDVSRKVAKALCRPGRIALPNHHVIVSRFPDDDKLRALPWLASADARQRLLEKMLPNRHDLWSCDLEPIRYKPERRYVARLVCHGKPQAVIKAYSPSGYDAASIHAKAFRADDKVELPARLGRSNRHCLLALGWLPGRLLTEILGDDEFDDGTIRRVGTALAFLHGQRSKKLRLRQRSDEAASFRPLANWLAAVCPQLDRRAHALADSLGDRFLLLPSVDCAVHGDFYAKQVVVVDDSVGIIDFDEAFRGDPAHDLGLFLAHLERDTLRLQIRPHRVDPVRNAFLAGYRSESPSESDAERVSLYSAAGLLRIAAHPFRHREPDWPERTAALLDRAERELQAAGPRTVVAATTPIAAATPDSSMPYLADALDRRRADSILRRNKILTDCQSITGARMSRHKPGRRCIIEYEVASRGEGRTTLLGKARAKGLDRATFELVRELRGRGFAESSFDCIAVPEPVGVVPEFHMWLQRKIDGVSGLEALSMNDSLAIAPRLADAIHKLHRANLPTSRRHTAAEELAVLESLYDELARNQPQWSRRLKRVLDACRLQFADLPEVPLVCIHRDFYPDQILVAGETLYLLDLDLYCAGDPALDAGNFLGHVTEYSLRSFGDERAWADRVRAFEERFVELAGPKCRRAVQSYQSATLARHVALSQRFSDRQHCTEALLDLCERRFRLGVSGLSTAPVSSKHRLSIGE